MKTERRVVQRRQGTQGSDSRRRGDRRRDAFGAMVEAIPTAKVNSALVVSDSRIEIRCPAPVKVEMETIAGRYGLTLTDYLLRLHAVAREKLMADD